MGEKEKLLEEIRVEWLNILQAWETECHLHKEEVLVIGCSSSEVLGRKIGTAGSAEVADVLIGPLLDFTDQLGAYPAFQCCEHLNRALIVERECAEKYGLEPVTVIPSLQAGGAMATAAWSRLKDPVAVEQIRAHAGIDIGDTLIGMHLRSVVVPVRLGVKSLGQAHITFARTRPKYIGGPRASYPVVGSNK